MRVAVVVRVDPRRELLLNRAVLRVMLHFEHFYFLLSNQIQITGLPALDRHSHSKCCCS